MSCLPVLNGGESPFSSQPGAVDDLIQSVRSVSLRDGDKPATLSYHTQESVPLLGLGETTSAGASSISGNFPHQDGDDGDRIINAEDPDEQLLVRLVGLNRTLEEISHNIDNNAFAAAGHRMQTLFAETSEQGHGSLRFLFSPSTFRAVDDVNEVAVTEFFLVHDNSLHESLRFERARFKKQLPEVFHRLLLRQASVMDAIVTGASLVGLCNEVDLEFPQPMCPEMCIDHWGTLGSMLASIGPPVQASDVLPEPLQVLYELGVFSEIEPALEWLRSQGETLMAMAELAEDPHCNILLPKIVPLETFTRMGAELQNIYTIVTASIGNRHKYGIAESIPVSMLERWRIGPDEAGYLGLPNVWLENAQEELEAFHDLAAILDTFCCIVAHLPARDIDRQCFVEQKDANLLSAVNDIYSIEIPPMIAKIKGSHANDNEDRQQRHLLRKAKRIVENGQIWPGNFGDVHGKRYRLYGPRRVLSPMKCLVPDNLHIMDENTLQRLQQSQPWLGAMIDNVHQTRQIAGTLLRCLHHEFFQYTLAVRGGW